MIVQDFSTIRHSNTQLILLPSLRNANYNYVGPFSNSPKSIIYCSSNIFVHKDLYFRDKEIFDLCQNHKNVNPQCCQGLI